MRHLRLIPTAFLLAVSAVTARAAPVYLHIDSRFPSGHYTRQLLENRTRKTQLQRWFRVETKDKAYGWIPEDDLVTALKLVNEATITETTKLRFERQLKAAEKETVSKGQLVTVLEVRGSWAQIRVRLPSGILRDAWLPTAKLKALVPPGPLIGHQNVFIPKETKLFVLPGVNARVQGTLPGASFANLVLDSRAANAEWLEVQGRFGPSGFVRRSEVVTASDLGENGARPLYDLVPLRSAPLPYANLTRNLPSSTALRVLGAQNLSWGMAKLSEAGEIWWPMAAEGADIDREPLIRERISTIDLFRRKIFDMASSPAIPKLKFVSAQGVYRTNDGNEWTKIPLFQDKNYPIAIAGLGSVFVGPYVSDDHGETFQQWIRWDTLVATIKRHTRLTARHLRIEEIRPDDPTGKRVVLRLSVDTDTIVKLVTDDQGMSWRPL